MSEHVVSTKVYIGIWAALMVLTAVTVGAAFIDLGAFNPVVALAIAAVKATLVVLFFMHIYYEHQRIVWAWVGAGFFWLIILLTLSLTDYGTRGFLGVAGR